MKKIFIILGAMIASNAIAADLDYGLYLRAPVSTYSAGGKGIQLSNPGSRGNDNIPRLPE